MTPERDQQISALFHAARALTPEQRPVFLAQISADDELRREVEALLAGDEQAGDFLNQPAQQVAAHLIPEGTSSVRALPVGSEFNHYRILSRLGAGGMGEIYLAEDTQLGRCVALKFLPADFTAAAEPVRRFIREARTASALNHPNIITIHEIGQAQTELGKRHFIVTEFIDGLTLRARMQRSPMPLVEVLDVAIQAASALAAAHEAGIIHRDIKPENVMLRRDGYVKVLDFGLAKLTEGARSGEIEERNNSGSQSLSTTPGMVLGTARYMSPEQARGQEVDARTDIFSFGVMLYEMIVGRAPFAGVNAIEVMGAILHQEAAPLPDMPDELQRIVTKTLRKDRAERYQTIADLLLDLKDLKHRMADAAPFGRAVPSGQTEAVTRRLQTAATDETRVAQTTSSTQIILGEFKRHKLGVVLTFAFVAVLSTAAYLAWNRQAAVAPATPFSPVPFSGLPGRERYAAFSPDGNQLAFSWDGGAGVNTDIYVKLIGTGAPLRLTSAASEEVLPTWSPDGRNIAFLRMGKEKHELLIVPALGGAERRLGTVENMESRISWSPDGKWLVACDTPDGSSDTPIMLISVESGEKHPLTRPTSPFDDSQPAFSPDGQQVVFVRTSTRTADELYLVSVRGGDEQQLTTGSHRIYGVDWTADGRAVIYSSTRAGKPTLWRLPVTGGEPTAVPGVGWDVIWPAVSRPAVSSKDGMLAFTESYDDTNIMRQDLPPDRHQSGPENRGLTPLVVSKRDENSPQISPDGQKIAFVSDRSGSIEIWVCDRDGNNPLQLTRMRHAEAGTPRWSPDSQRLVFDAKPDRGGDLFVINATGGTPQRLTTEPSHDVMPSWSHDGQWIYFCSNRGGDYQIWKMPAAGGAAVQMTRHGGFEAFESLDGQTLYFSKWRGVDGLWSVPASGGTEQPVPELAQAGYWRAWAVTQDGIYYVAHKGATPPHPIQFFSFATRLTTQLGVVEKSPPWYVGSLTAARDGQWLLYAQPDRQVSTLMLVENFH